MKLQKASKNANVPWRRRATNKGHNFESNCLAMNSGLYRAIEA